MAQVKGTVEVDGSGVHVLLAGPINEHAKFPEIPGSGQEAITINMNAVSYINSSGIQQWVKWLNKVKKNSPQARVIFKKCPKIIVDQMNYIEGFLPERSRVGSFYIPFYCESCEVGSEVLLVDGEHYDKDNFETGQTPKYPSCNCAKCSKPMEADVLPQQYFRFLIDKE